MEYDIIRSARKTLSVTVKDGRVIVKAPNKVSERKIAEFVERHKLWIFRRIQEQEGRYRPNFSDGSSIELFGNTVKIETGKAALTSEKLFLPNENREEALKKLLKSLTRDFMTAMTAAIAEKYRFRYSKIVITSARSRWGSCNIKGTIAYSFRSAFLPPELAFYLAAHELCHTKHMNHSRAFWETLAKIVPDCKEKRRRLKEYLWAMKCL